MFFKRCSWMYFSVFIIVKQKVLAAKNHFLYSRISEVKVNEPWSSGPGDILSWVDHIKNPGWNTPNPPSLLLLVLDHVGLLTTTPCFSPTSRLYASPDRSAELPGFISLDLHHSFEPTGLARQPTVELIMSHPVFFLKTDMVAVAFLQTSPW